MNRAPDMTIRVGVILKMLLVIVGLGIALGGFHMWRITSTSGVMPATPQGDGLLLDPPEIDFKPLLRKATAAAVALSGIGLTCGAIVSLSRKEHA
jgi:hypothetical protein